MLNHIEFRIEHGRADEETAIGLAVSSAAYGGGSTARKRITCIKPRRETASA